MGNSRWDDTKYTAYAASTNYRSLAPDQVFTTRGEVKEKLDPRNVKVGKGERKGRQLRESIISEENPNPTPIILGLDVTGSMGAVAVKIAQDHLPKLMTDIHKTGIVSDPHVMFMGIDDVFAQGHGALQTSYFEPDLRIVEQLRDMWIVKNGGGNGSESYDLAWYFAGHYTYLESYEKQNRKGFLFTFGDEAAPFAKVSASNLKTIFGPGDYEGATPEASLKAAQEKYQVFHITVEESCGYNRGLRDSWTKMLGPNALFLRDSKNLSELVIATMAIANGASAESVIAESQIAEELRYAFSNLLGA